MPVSKIETSDSRIACELDGEGIAVVRILRPEKRNALSLSMWRATDDLFQALSADDRLRCVIFAGEGPHFSAGADISEFGEVRADAAAGLAYDRVCDQATMTIRNCSKPVVAAVSGYAVGGGLGLALACDFRVADATARMGIPAGRLGLVYSLVDCGLLAERIGVTRAKEVLFTGTIFSLEDALRLGLVDRLAEGDALAAARVLAGEIASNAPLSLAGNKAILNAAAEGTMRERRVELEGFIARAFNSRDYAEGQSAFAERRPPRFTGS